LLIGALPPLEQRVADVLAVMDAVGSGSAVLSGAADGGQVAILLRGDASRSRRCALSDECVAKE
jgi:hypothetical protein